MRLFAYRPASELSHRIFTRSFQVFAVNTGFDHVYFRSDVTPSELSGHEWKILKIGATLTESMTSLSSESSPDQHEGTRGML